VDVLLGDDALIDGIMMSPASERQASYASATSSERWTMVLSSSRAPGEWLPMPLMCVP